jgi:hypothetical protein
MRYIGTEKIICPICKVELDVPVYQTDENKKYGMKFCHQCGNKLFSEPIEDFEDLASSINEGIKARYGYTAAQISSYWQGVDDYRRAYDVVSRQTISSHDKVYTNISNSILKKIDNIEMCLCNIYNTGYTVQKSDEIFIDKQLKLIKAELRK